MKMKRIILLSASVAIVCTAGIHLSCDSDPSSAGNGSDTPNAALGKLVYANGDPAAGASVTLYASGADPRSASPAGVAVTGSDGRYVLTALEAGAYNVLGAKDNARSFSASNDIAGADTTVLPTDTLRETGSVCGVVKLVGDIDTADIYLLVLGTGEFAEADTGGHFCFQDLAAGEYEVRILTTVDGFGPKDTVVSVIEGLEVQLVDTVWVNSDVVPVPTGLLINYDTLRQIVHLSWGPLAADELIRAYYVYRERADSVGFARIAAVTDTSLYADSTVLQEQQYRYAVAALDTLDREGTRSNSVQVWTWGAYSQAYEFAVGDGSEDIALRMDPRKRIYLYKSLPGEIEARDSSGNLVSTMPFGPAEDIVSDTADNLYSVSRSDTTVRKWDSEDRLTVQWSFHHFFDNVAYFSTPTPRIDAKGDRLYVYDDRQVLIYSAEGSLTYHFLLSSGDVPACGLPDGGFLVVDTSAGRLVAHHSSAQRFGTVDFSLPRGVVEIRGADMLSDTQLVLCLREYDPVDDVEMDHFGVFDLRTGDLVARLGRYGFPLSVRDFAVGRDRRVYVVYGWGAQGECTVTVFQRRG